LNIEDIARRLQVLEDKDAIKELHRDYVYNLNNKEWDGMADSFTEDAVLKLYRHPLLRGKAQIRDYFVEEMSKVNSGMGRDSHFATMPVVEIQGDKARGHWMLYILIADPVTGNALKWKYGRYEVKYEKIAGKWKFKQLVWITPWPRQPDTLPKLEDLKELGIEM
jgi:ketosteroid isomerase-like protein